MFDALSYSETLISTGVAEDTARLQAKGLSEALESNDLATKADITELRANVKTNIVELKADIIELRANVTADIVVLKTDITGFKVDIKADITELKSGIKAQTAETEARIAEMELRIIKWQIGGIGLVIAAIKFL